MKQQIDVTCNCIPNLFSSQEKLFLMRKKNPNIQETPASRRGHNSTEFKYQSQGKTLKKSLKKRAISHLSGDKTGNQTHLLENHQTQHQQRSHLEKEQLNRADFSFARMDQVPTSQARIGYNYPNYTQQMDPRSKPRSYNIFQDQRQFTHQIPEFTKYAHHPSGQPKPIKQMIYQTGEAFLQPAIAQPITFSHRPTPSNYLNHPKQKIQDHQHIQKIHFPAKTSLHHSKADSNVSNCSESLLIQEFDRFFSNKEEHQSLTNFNHQGKPYIIAREKKKIHHGEKTLLMGRFAESDNQSNSQSTPSLVIGKGLSSHFLDFWQSQQSNCIKQTQASRTTNTKHSQLQKGTQLDDHQRPKFGNIQTFQSYKNL